MKFFWFMAPITFCSLGIIISAYNPLIGLITSSIGLPLWFVLRWLDPENKQQSKPGVEHE